LAKDLPLLAIPPNKKDEALPSSNLTQELGFWFEPNFKKYQSKLDHSARDQGENLKNM